MLKLAYFVSLAETLSFTKAAKENHITQACMSRQISALENELGVSLFIRNSRNVKLSPEGEEFYWHAQSILNSYNYAMEKITNIQHSKVYLRIGLGPYEHALVKPVFEKFTARHPDVVISCLQYDYTTLANNFRNGAIDVMFCIDHCAEKIRYIDTIELYDGEWITLCCKNSPLVAIEHPKLSQFNHQVFINMEANTDDIQMRESMNLGFKPLHVIQTNTLSSKFALTAAGVGICRVPKFIENFIPGDVAILGCNYPSIRRFQCAYVKSKKQDSVLTSFVEIVRSMFPIS